MAVRKPEKMPPFDGKESAKAWEEFYERQPGKPKRRAPRVIEKREVLAGEPKPTKKVKRK